MHPFLSEEHHRYKRNARRGVSGTTAAGRAVLMTRYDDRQVSDPHARGNDNHIRTSERNQCYSREQIRRFHVLFYATRDGVDISIFRRMTHAAPRHRVLHNTKCFSSTSNFLNATHFSHLFGKFLFVDLSIIL